MPKPKCEDAEEPKINHFYNIIRLVNWLRVWGQSLLRIIKYKEGNNRPSSGNQIHVSLVHKHDKAGNKCYTQDDTDMHIEGIHIFDISIEMYWHILIKLGMHDHQEKGLHSCAIGVWALPPTHL